MPIGSLILEIHFDGLDSLKSKRSLLKPLLFRLRKEFNISISEYGLQNNRNKTLFRIAFVNSDPNEIQSYIYRIIDFIKIHYPEYYIANEKLEIL